MVVGPVVGPISSQIQTAAASPAVSLQTGLDKKAFKIWKSHDQELLGYKLLAQRPSLVSGLLPAGKQPTPASSNPYW